MIQIILTVLLVFIYPFLSKSAGYVVIAIAALLTIIGLVILNESNWIRFLITNAGLFAIGAFIRHFVQKARYKSDVEDLMNQYNDKP